MVAVVGSGSPAARALTTACASHTLLLLLLLLLLWLLLLLLLLWLLLRGCWCQADACSRVARERCKHIQRRHTLTATHAVVSTLLFPAVQQQMLAAAEREVGLHLQ